MRSASAVLGVLLLAGTPRTQDVSVQPITPLEFELGNLAGIRVTVSDVDAAELLPLPEIDGLVLEARGPSQLVQPHFVNGRRSVRRSISWDVVARADREGEFLIPKLRLRVDGKLRETPQQFRLRCTPNRLAKGRSFVELHAEPARPFVHQTVKFTVRFGLVPELHSYLSPIRYRVSLPVQIRAPWLLRFPHGLESAREESGARLQCVLENVAVPAHEARKVEQGGNEYFVFEVRRYFDVTKVGEHELSRVGLVFDWADPRQRPDIFGRRHGTRVGSVFSDGGLTLEVRPLPEDGRPQDFRNAVGRFTLSASVSKRRVEVGENFELQLVLGGEGNMEFVELPELLALSGFNRFGDAKVERGAQQVVARYDLVALSDDVRELPSVELAYFDPERERYDVARSTPIPLEVVPLPEQKKLDVLPGENEALVAGVDDIHDRMPVQGPAPRNERMTSGTLLVLLLGPWGLFAVLAGFGFWRRARLANPARLRRVRAAPRFERSLDELGPLRAFSAYLGDVTDQQDGALLEHGASERLRDLGVPDELSHESARLLEELSASRYGGGPSEADGKARARELVRRIEAAV